MTKSEFIAFLKEKQESRGINLSHWRQTYENSDDFWHLYIPFREWEEDKILLRFEGIVIMTTNKSLYGNNSKVIEMTYDEFIKNYDKTLGN